MESQSGQRCESYQGGINMKLLKRVAAAAAAAVMCAAMLTACGGGGGAGGGGTPIAPAEFKSTKTYKMMQEEKNKPVYTEYWLGGTDRTGALVEDKDTIYKAGYQNGSTYVDLYNKNSLQLMVLNNGKKNYEIFSRECKNYDSMVEMMTMSGVEIPEGKSIYFDTDRVVQETTGGSTDGGYIVSGMDQLKESEVVVSTGTYRGYYAEIFTWKTDPKKTLTLAFDENDELKAEVGVDHDKTTAVFYNKCEIDSPMFKAARLDIANYNAVDVTDAYIAVMKQLMQEQH